MWQYFQIHDPVHNREDSWDGGSARGERPVSTNGTTNTGQMHKNISIRTHDFSIRFEVFTSVTMKNVVFWDIKTSSYFTGDTLRLHYTVQPVNAM
jgi:hypothetical protein